MSKYLTSKMDFLITVKFKRNSPGRDMCVCVCVCVLVKTQKVFWLMFKKNHLENEIWWGRHMLVKKYLSFYLFHIFLDFSFAKLQYLLSLKRKKIAFGNSIFKSYSTT